MGAAEILVDEFGCYYLGDELQVGPDFVREYDDWILSSARRMKVAAGPDGVGSLVALLRELKQDPRHPLHARITDSMIVWNDDETFAIFGQLADALIEHLTAGPLLPTAVTYDYGNEHDPVARLGRIVVELSDDLKVLVTHIKHGQRRAWVATLSASVWPDVIAHLVAGAFPARFRSTAPVPSGTPSFSVAVRLASGKVSTVQLPGGVPLKGYRELSALMFSLVGQVSSDILGFEPPAEPRLVSDVARG